MVGNGKLGAITKQIQKVFFGIVSGSAPDSYKWFTQVPVKQTVGV
jgi:hypothetical protein